MQFYLSSILFALFLLINLWTIFGLGRFQPQYLVLLAVCAALAANAIYNQKRKKR